MSNTPNTPDTSWFESIDYSYSNICLMWINQKDLHLAFGEQFPSKTANICGQVMSLPQAKQLCQDLARLLAGVEAVLGEIPLEPKVRALDS